MLRGFKLVAVGFGVAACAMAAAVPAHATVWTMNDLNSTVQIDDSSQSGVFTWTVDGVDHMYQEQFWYRVGSTGPEASVDTLTLVGVSQGSHSLELNYAADGFTVDLIYTLLGGTDGSNRSDLAEQIRIVNTSGSSLDMHFFEYSDFDLGDSGGDTVQFLSPFAMQQYDPLYLLSETIATPPASHWQVGGFPGIRTSLNDAGPTTLNDFGGPYTGDATWAFQWDVSIARGGSYLISKDKQLRPIPEPTTLVLLGAGLLGLAVRRRRS